MKLHDPYGRTTVDGSAVNPPEYSGRENDGAALYYYRTRSYDSAV